MSECYFPGSGTWCATHKSTRGLATNRCDRGQWIDCERRIEAALKRHWPRHDDYEDREITCGHCGWEWPCPTLEVLRGGETE